MSGKRKPIGLPMDGATEQELQREASSNTKGQEIELLSRLALGALLMGSDELTRRLQQAQQSLEAEPEFAQQDLDTGEETVVDLLRYMGIGLLAQGQRRMARRVRRGYYFSLGVTSWFVESLDRATDNPLVRPVRRPIETQLERLGQEIGRVVTEGRLEEQKARQLTEETLSETVEEVFVSVSDSPEVEILIRRVVGQQSAGLAGVIVGNTRRVSVSADNLVEGIARRLLRRKPRAELPPSPLLGKPQSMYALEEKDGLPRLGDEGAVVVDYLNVKGDAT